MERKTKIRVVHYLGRLGSGGIEKLLIDLWDLHYCAIRVLLLEL